MTAVTDEPTAEELAQLDELYADFAAANMAPLWTQRGGLMPQTPSPHAVPALWRWSTLYPLAARSGELVPVGRGGERRAIALANPGLPGTAYATPTLWAAIQYLGPREEAPAHRHTQTAFRFVVEGEGVWTNVVGDPVAMRRGDLLLTPGMHWHEHHNTTDHPMAWIDGLDIPLVRQLDAGFFEFGPEVLSTTETPAASRNERLWGHPGLRPVGAPAPAASPLMAYRWEHTDAALAAQLELEAEGHPGVVSPGHAVVRFTNPATGRDALSTIRTEMHRLGTGARSLTTRVAGSGVWQVFSGSGSVTVGDETWDVGTGDLFAVPSWAPVTIRTDGGLDAFRFSDDPVFEALGLARTSVEDGS
ncbi:cupin domain-containing protein [Pseudonocardia petroleophila]|uniref:Cupin domain-containing protein n=1 Tax=Pseudonocardia petroleophila TaxID=37331 RepID=A0A7G7MLK3_9PSEU|nr:cupin domain-containing protein [Pseudonocardia petroleophila]QNG53664.1 cupin domain-containing protein [Pseudonocardia petroleophila]